MATQYTSILKLALPTAGELDGTWGDVVNNNITSMVEEAIAGLSTINTWSTNSHTLTTANGTTSESRAAILILTDTGAALTGAGEVICPAESKTYIVYNNTGESITVKTSGGTGVSIPNGKRDVVYCDGTNVENAITNGERFLTTNYSVSSSNVGVGGSVFASLTSGSNNVAVGSSSLTSATTGANNSAVGKNSLDSLTSGSGSTAVGSESLSSLTTGTFQVAVGYTALDAATTGSSNVAVGSSALTSVSTSSYNTGVGDSAGGGITTGSYNTAIGGDAMAFAGAVTGSNLTCLGYNAQPSSTSATNEITLGNSSIATLRCNVTSISSLSDIRDKKDIIDSPYGLDVIEKIKPRQFVWDSRKGNIKDGKSEVGFIAQELLEAGDNSVLNLVMDSNPEFLEATPGSLIPILVKAVQELSQRVKELESKA